MADSVQTGHLHPSSYNTKEQVGKTTLNPASTPFDTRTLGHRALGVQHSTPLADLFKPLVEAALARAVGEDAQHLAKYDDATIARLMSTARYYGLELRKVSDSSSSSSRIPSNDSSLSSLISRMPLTPGQIAAHHASKADVSANWRVKGKYHDPTGHIEVHSPSKQFAVPAESPPPGPIMTIDELMEKFSSPPGKVCVTVQLAAHELIYRAMTRPLLSRLLLRLSLSRLPRPSQYQSPRSSSPPLHLRPRPSLPSANEIPT